MFQKADDALKRTKITIFEDKIIFIIDHVLESLSQNPKMTTFISKNLSWGIFKSALIHSDTDQTLDFYSVYERMIEDSPHEFKNPEILPDSGNVIVPAFLVGLVKDAKPGLTVYTVGPMSFDGRERLGAIGLIKN